LFAFLQAREYLYYKVFGKQETTPVAIMTSAAKGNHQKVLKLLEDSNWFGRGKEAFRQRSVHLHNISQFCLLCLVMT
jgi:hypothetical protein